MKKLFGLLAVGMLALSLVACDGAGISREGNKIFIGRSPSQVFSYAEKAVSYFGLSTVAKSRENGFINTQVTNSTALNRYGAANVNFEISGSGQNSTVTVKAIIAGEYDPQKSEQAAAQIVNRLIAYLNTFDIKK